jgi:hypothetical protein
VYIYHIHVNKLFVTHVIKCELPWIIRTRCNRETPKGACTFGVLIVASIWIKDITLLKKRRNIAESGVKHTLLKCFIFFYSFNIFIDKYSININILCFLFRYIVRFVDGKDGNFFILLFQIKFYFSNGKLLGIVYVISTN